MTSDHSLTIEFENDGSQWTQILEYKIQDDFLVPTDAWSVTVFDPDPVKLRRKFRPLEPVRLYLGDRLQLIGRIDGTEGAGGGDGALRVWGRDYLATLVDANVDPSVRVTNQMSVADALLEGFRVFGITKIEGDVEQAQSKKMGVTTRLVAGETDEEARARYRDQFSERPETQAFIDAFKRPDRMVPFTARVPDTKPNDGAGAFEWGNRIAARAGLTIQAAASRDTIAVVAPNYSPESVYDLVYPGNVELGVARRDWGNLPTVVVTSSRVATAGLEAKGQWREIRAAGDESPSSLWLTPEGQRILGEVGVVSARLRPGATAAPPLLYRPMYFRDDDAKTLEQLEKSARRQLADRMKSTLTYTATLQGHTDPRTGATFATNVMAAVFDRIEDVNELLWSSARTLSFDQGGARTQLQLIRPASFVL